MGGNYGPNGWSFFGGSFENCKTSGADTSFSTVLVQIWWHSGLYCHYLKILLLSCHFFNSKVPGTSVSAIDEIIPWLSLY